MNCASGRLIHDRDKARGASTQATGGGLTELYDDLHDNKVLVSMCVVCPSAKDARESKANEQRLRCVFLMLSELMHDQIIDIFTSRKEIGGVHGCGEQAIHR